MSEALGCANVTKAFGALVAVRDVSLSVASGSIHAVIGENGAGKSTLMRALYGMMPIDAGTVRLGGVTQASASVERSIAAGVGMVHQHFMLVPNMTVAENMLLGRERLARGRLALVEVSVALEKLAAQIGLPLPPAFGARRVETLAVGDKQRVEILRVLMTGARTLILDEPTAVLAPSQVGELFAALKALQATGATIVIVTHKLDEVLRFAEHVTVMRKGEVVANLATAATDAAALAAHMIGRPLPSAAVVASPARDGVRLEVDNVAHVNADGRETLHEISLRVRPGEIFGICGIEGNGQTELIEILAGLQKCARGHVATRRRGLREPERARAARARHHTRRRRSPTARPVLTRFDRGQLFARPRARVHARRLLTARRASSRHRNAHRAIRRAPARPARDREHAFGRQSAKGRHRP